MTQDIKQILEGLLFVAESPLSRAQMQSILDGVELSRIDLALEELGKEYDFLDRAFTLAHVAGGYALRTRPELASWIRRLKKQQEARLSPASLETLAIIAYKQPVLRAEIERLRGVDVGGVLRVLMEKSLVRVVGRKDLPGRPLIYGTTKYFLELFGLSDLKELPTLEEMESLMNEAAKARQLEPEQGELNLGDQEQVRPPMERRSWEEEEFEQPVDTAPDSTDDNEAPESADHPSNAEPDTEPEPEAEARELAMDIQSDLSPAPDDQSPEPLAGQADLSGHAPEPETLPNGVEPIIQDLGPKKTES